MENQRFEIQLSIEILPVVPASVELTSVPMSVVLASVVLASVVTAITRKE